jgi:hypothetical protein
MAWGRPSARAAVESSPEAIAARMLVLLIFSPPVRASLTGCT